MKKIKKKSKKVVKYPVTEKEKRQAEWDKIMKDLSYKGSRAN